MRNFVLCYVNGKRYELSGASCFFTLAEWLREERRLTGTKIVCAEGDCGACTVLVARFTPGRPYQYQAINACITYPYLLDCCHIVTVEGLGSSEHPHPIQSSMVATQGTQCGYCTPGFVCSYAGLVEKAKAQGEEKLDQKKIKNYLTGNLCRCTGYEPIIQAGLELKLEQIPTLAQKYPQGPMLADFEQHYRSEVKLQTAEREAFLPKSLSSAIQSFTAQKQQNRPVLLTSGATDLGVLANKGKLAPQGHIALNNIPELYQIEQTDKLLTIGAKASLTQVEAACEVPFPEFARKLHVFASPQIKNKATLVGNVANGSPIGDSIPFLMVSGAYKTVVGPKGAREIEIAKFYKGYKQLALELGEFISHIHIPINAKDRYKLYKVSIRKDLDISTVTFAARLQLEGTKIGQVALALGGVAATVLRLYDLEQAMLGQNLDQKLVPLIDQHLKLAIRPLSDIRGSSDFRAALCHNLFLKWLDESACEFGISCEVSL